MLNLARILLCFILAFAVTATCFAQQHKRPKTTNRKTATTPVREEVSIEGTPVVIVKPDEVRQAGQASVSYRRDVDQTSIGVTLPNVYRKGQVTVSLDISFGFKGREAGKPDNVYLSLLSDWTIFKGQHSLVVIADDKHYKFVTEPSAQDNVSSISMDFASYQQIVNSKSTRVSIGQVSFELTDAQRQALRDTLKAAESPFPKQ
jgi:hypothetical protein